MPKFIFVAGGVMSGIGKGIAVASIGKILQSKGFKVTAVKIDPYINVDAGTMNPVEHGEVFVTDDGTESDQDLGNYERFFDETLGADNYITTGRVYQAVINRERNLEYKGKCVEVVPDIPNEVIARIKKAARLRQGYGGQAQKKGADFVLIEIGGTVGEYQNMLFLEAARMMKLQLPKNVLFILVSYLPVPKIIGEMKTKPTQYAARTLNSAGIQPDIILARSVLSLDEPRKQKISTFCNIDKENVISAPDIESIYEVPVNFEKDNLGNIILKKFNIKSTKKDLKDWRKMVNIIKTVEKPVKIGIVGKYFETGKFTLTDSYISVIEAVKHSSWFHKRKPEISWLSAGEYEKNPEMLKELKNYDGIIVPGGFGNRGVEGKIKVIEFCRKNKIPFLGLCLGMQLAVIEFARNVCKLKDANSTEFFKNCKNNVIDVMPEQKILLKEKKYGATMRLGKYECEVKPKTISFKAYLSAIAPAGAPGLRSRNGCFGGVGKEDYLIISERHRHRYELNNAFRDILQDKGMLMAGANPDRDLVEIVELPHSAGSGQAPNVHPFFVGTQFHPELKSRPLNPHPLFKAFVKSCIKNV